jgi:hypothetical protein
MTLSAQKLRSIVNLLSDPGSAANAAAILSREARERGVLVADLIGLASTSAPSPPTPPASTAPTWQDVGGDDDGPYVKRINADHVVATAMTPADRLRLQSSRKAQARYRWRQMDRAIAAHDREAYERHAAWRSAICRELRDLDDPVLVALRNHPGPSS